MTRNVECQKEKQFLVHRYCKATLPVGRQELKQSRNLYFPLENCEVNANFPLEKCNNALNFPLEKCKYLKYGTIFVQSAKNLEKLKR